MTNEIARELLRNGKSVSKESYYVIILVCANKRGGGRGWSASGSVLFIAIVNNYEHRQRGLVAHLNGINQKFLKCLTFLANKLLYFNNSRLYSYFPSMRIPNFVILLILPFPSVVSGFIMWTNTVRIKTFFSKIHLITLEYRSYKYPKILSCNNCYLFFTRSIFISIKTFCP